MGLRDRSGTLSRVWIQVRDYTAHDKRRSETVEGRNEGLSDRQMLGEFGKGKAICRSTVVRDEFFQF